MIFIEPFLVEISAGLKKLNHALRVPEYGVVISSSIHTLMPNYHLPTFAWHSKVWRRSSIGQVDPMGGDFPLITREGHNVLDVIFTSPIQSLGRSIIMSYSHSNLFVHALSYSFPQPHTNPNLQLK